MAKSKHRKDHNLKLDKYKKNKKIEQELLKKKLQEQYMKMQQEELKNREAHTSTEEVSLPDIDVDGLIEDFETVDVSNSNILIEDVEFSEVNNNNNNTNDNNNK
jgi:hypothetical protein